MIKYLYRILFSTEHYFQLKSFCQENKIKLIEFQLSQSVEIIADEETLLALKLTIPCEVLYSYKILV